MAVVTCRLTIRCVYARVHRTNLSPVYSLIRVTFSPFFFSSFFFISFYTIVRQNRESPVNLNEIRSCTYNRVYYNTERVSTSNQLFFQVRFLPRSRGSSDSFVRFRTIPWQKRWIDPRTRSIFRGCLRPYEFCFSSFLPWYKTRWKILVRGAVGLKAARIESSSLCSLATALAWNGVGTKVRAQNRKRLGNALEILYYYVPLRFVSLLVSDARGCLRWLLFGIILSIKW